MNFEITGFKKIPLEAKKDTKGTNSSEVANNVTTPEELQLLIEGQDSKQIGRASCRERVCLYV